ncbi:Tyrosine-protein kinase Fyn [Halotydeus destructor]|nr:Tyrosine-protein kinase Fyn [Halotydeus destructor]
MGNSLTGRKKKQKGMENMQKRYWNRMKNPTGQQNGSAGKSSAEATVKRNPYGGPPGSRAPPMSQPASIEEPPARKAQAAYQDSAPTGARPKAPTVQATTSMGEVLVALYPYEAHEDNEMTMDKGDRLLILRRDDARPDWYFCRKIKDDPHAFPEEGHVPINFLGQDLLEGEEWFFGKITRSDASKILLFGPYPKGTFLIRSSENSDGYSLTVRTRDQENGDQIKHYRIQRQGGHFYIAPDKAVLESATAARVLQRSSQRAVLQAHASVLT